MSLKSPRSKVDAWLATIPDAPVFRPTKEEFADDPLAYIKKIAPEGAKHGICKIVPPSDWSPGFHVNREQLVFPTRIQNTAKLNRYREHMRMKQRMGKILMQTNATLTEQNVDKVDCEVCKGGCHEEVMLLCSGCNKGFHTFCLTPPLEKVPEDDWVCPNCHSVGEDIGFESGKQYSFSSFNRVANLFKQKYFDGRDPATVTTREIESEFWQIVEHKVREVEVLYGSDLDTAEYGSGFPLTGDDKYVKSSWNLNNIARSKGSLLTEIASEITGVTVPWLYVGMMFSAFCWHNEDHYMYSIAYHHQGDVKTWYGVPGDKSELFEKAMHEAMPELFEAHPDLLFQLVTMVSPQKLMKCGVPICRLHQHPGEFVVTFPAAYHAGFSHGVNFTEAVNFATADWLPMGSLAVRHYHKYHRNPVFSHDELVLLCCKPESAAAMTPAMYDYVLGELEAISTAEKRLRSRLRSSQQQGMLLVRCVSKDSNGKSIDSLQGRNCAICFHQLFLSGITCECSPGKVVCLSHADQLCVCPPQKRCLHVRFTLSELDAVAKQVRALCSSSVCIKQEFKHDIKQEPDTVIVTSSEHQAKKVKVEQQSE